MTNKPLVIRKIYLEPTYKLHVGYHLRELIPYPPQGYEFVVNEGKSDGMAKWVSAHSFGYKLFTRVSQLVPSVLMKSYLGRFMNKPPEGTELTFSLNHLILRKEPWIIEIDATWDPIGPRIGHFKRYRKVAERAFASDCCKKVLCTSEFSRKMLLSHMNCSGFEHKIGILPRAVSSKQFTKERGDSKVRLFFLGSANLSGQFEIRGGKEVLEAFAILSRKYDNIELVIRSDISVDTRKRYEDILQMQNVRTIDSFLPTSELSRIFQTSDIFLIPAHFADWLVMMEAMSFELPIVAVDVYAASEYIDDGKTGLLIKSSQEVPYFDDGIPVLFMTSKLKRAIRKVDPKVVTELVDKTSVLIGNKAMREKMGKAGRWEIEHGRFSIANRNATLKKVFDEAVD